MLSDELLEAAVLQSIITMRRGTYEALQRLDPECFYKKIHAEIFRAVQRVNQRGEVLSELAVRNELSLTEGYERTDQLIGEMLFIAAQNQELMLLERMVDILVELSQRRRLAHVISDFDSLCFTRTEALDEGIARIQSSMDQIMGVGQRDDFVNLSQLMDEAWQHALDNQNPDTQHLGLQTGIEMIDRDGGLSEGLTIVGARPSHGKSAFALHQALRAMRAGRRVGFFSLEMTNLQLTQRLLSMQSGLSSSDIARQKLLPFELERLDQARAQLNLDNAVNFRFDNRSRSSLDHMMQSIRAMCRNEGLNLVVVDYLQLLNITSESRDENTAQRLARASHLMHDVARDEGLYILCLSQLNRNSTGIPQRSQLRDSGGIDEAADNVILLYRGQMDHLKVYPSPYDDYPTEGSLLMLLDKNRNGATSWSIVGFDPRRMEFDMDWMRKHRPDASQGVFHLPD